MSQLINWREQKTKRGTTVRVATLPTHTLGKLYRDLEDRGHVARDNDDWLGATRDEIVDMMDRGNLKQLQRAQELASRVNAKIPVVGQMPEIKATVCGGRLSVPAFLSGRPNPFNRPVWDASAVSPVRIFFDVGCSGGLEAHEVELRGLAMLAFARALSARRPVELCAFGYYRVTGQSAADSLMLYPLGLKPVHWPMAGAVVGHAAFMRDLTFKVAREMVGKTGQTGIRWGSDYGGKYGGGAQDAIRELLGASKDDVVFDRGFLLDPVLRTDPVAWVQDELARFDKSHGA